MAAFKDQLNIGAVERIAASIHAEWPDFDHTGFVEATAARLEALELKGRVKHIADRLREYLPDDVPRAMALLVASLGPPGAPSGADAWGPDSADERHTSGFLVWPMTQFVQDHGAPHFEESMAALEELTRRFTAEFAIRPFAIAQPDRVLARAHAWTQSPDQHLRRLASEGLRPRLPWGQQLKQYIQDPAPVLDLLERLKDDPEEYVRRSVANHLNDITKDHPDAVVEVGARWLEGASKERAWIVKHACRTLIKKGHPGALRMLGFAVPPQLEVRRFSVAPRTLAVGGTLAVEVELRSNAAGAQKLAIDYVMHMQKARNKTSAKVWKGSERVLPAGESASLSFTRPLKAVSTRTYYPGRHDVDLVINGVTLGHATFDLEV